MRVLGLVHWVCLMLFVALIGLLVYASYMFEVLRFGWLYFMSGVVGYWFGDVFCLIWVLGFDFLIIVRCLWLVACGFGWG